MRSLGLRVTTMLLAGVLLPCSVSHANRWMPLRNETGEFVVPRLAFVDVASMRPGTRTAIDLRSLGDERWISNSQPEAGMLGLDSSQFASSIRHLRASQSLVVGRYAPQTAELRIEILRVERRRDGLVYVSVADFTPHHGERWRAYGQYRSVTERARGMPGYNPFDVHRGPPEDPLFHQVSAAASQVAMGQAMRLAGAISGWLAVIDHRFVARSQTSGGLFRRTVHWTIDGLVKPRWLLLTPLSMASLGATGALTCASPEHVTSVVREGAVSTDCDDPAHRVSSGVWAAEWAGGNLPAIEQALTHAEGSSSGLTLLADALIVGAVVFAASATASRLPGSAAGDTATRVSLVGDPGLGGEATRAASAAASAAGLIGSGAALLSGEAVLGRDITRAFAGLIDAGVGTPMAAPDAYAAQLFGAISASIVRAPLDASLSGIARFATGACDAALTGAACQASGLDPGSAPRPDSGVTPVDPSVLHEAGRDCALLGLTGRPWRTCTAPSPQGVLDGN